MATAPLPIASGRPLRRLSATQLAKKLSEPGDPAVRLKALVGHPTHLPVLRLLLAEPDGTGARAG